MTGFEKMHLIFRGSLSISPIGNIMLILSKSHKSEKGKVQLKQSKKRNLTGNYKTVEKLSRRWTLLPKIQANELHRTLDTRCTNAFYVALYLFEPDI